MNGDTLATRWLARIVVVRPGEMRALLWSFAYFFCLLAGYYVLRPLRDEMGNIVRWYGTCTDVDDLKRAQATATATPSLKPEAIPTPRAFAG